MSDQPQETSIYSLPDDLEATSNQADELAGRMHEGHDTFGGSDAPDAQIRRFQRAAYRDSDFAANDALEDYAGPRGAEIQTVEEWHGFLDHQDRAAREKYGDAYDQAIEFLKPELNKLPPHKLRELLLRDDAAELVYEVAKKHREDLLSRAPSQEEIENMDGEQFRARMDEWRRTARSSRDQDEEQPAPSLSKRDMRRMNQLLPADFAAVLDALKAKGF